MTNLIGQEIDGYQIVEQIGQGGMATVYKAYEAATDRYVALKILPHLYSDDPKFIERFKREARAFARLEHLHILPIHAYGEQDGITYLAMRYMPTGSLKDRIRQQGALPLHEASRLLSQIAGALDHAHRHGILHRDVKPANVLLDADENAYLTDFGIARMIGATADLTGGGIIGTPAYMPPEQLEENAEIVPASDQYALGIVLYEMVTGRTPYQAETPVAMITKKLTTHLPLPSTFRPELPEAAELVILKALARDPTARFASCTELAEQFAAALEGMPVDIQFSAASPDDMTYDSLPGTAAPAPTAAPAAPTVTGRQGMPAWLIGLIAVLGIGVIGAAIFFGLVSGKQAESDPDSLATQAAGAVQEAAAAIMNETQTADAAQAARPDDSANLITPDAVEPTALQPTPTVDPGLNFSEDFENPAFDGSYPLDRWTFSGASIDQVRQQTGELVITQVDRPNGSAELTATPLSAFTIDQPMYFEADLKLAANQPSDPQISGIVYLQIGTSLSDSKYWTSQCNIGAHAGTPTYLHCRDFAWAGADQNSYVLDLQGDFDTWHHYRIEVDPATMTFSYYIDDTLIGLHVPVDAEALTDARFEFRIGVWTKTDAPITGHIDNVRVGYLADEAAAQLALTVYDDFDNPEYDGGLNEALWRIESYFPDSYFIQQDGILIAHQEGVGGTSFLVTSTEYWSFTLDRPMFFEADLMLDGTEHLGNVQLHLMTDDWFAECCVNGVDILQVHCYDTLASDDTNGFFPRSMQIVPETWHTVRIEIDPETMTFGYFIDELDVGSHIPVDSEMLTDAQFRFLVGVWAASDEPVTGYIDNVRVGPLDE